MTRRGSATSRAPPLTAFGTDCGAQWATGAGMEEELMRYRQRQCLKGLLLCFLFSLVVTVWIYVLYNAQP
jgi:hypothetical protein